MGEATDAGVTGDSIKIASITDVTGGNASGHQGFEKGFEAYIEFWNDQGGAHGRTIELVSGDSASDPTRALDLVQTAVEQDGVFMTAGSYQTFGAAAYVAENGIPAVSRWGGFLASTGPGIFGTASNGSWEYDVEQPCPDGLSCNSSGLPLDPASGSILNYMALALGETKVGTFGYGVNAQSVQGAENNCNNAEDAGLECPFIDTSYNFGFPDIGAAVEEIRQADVHVFYAAMDVGGCITIARSLERAGIDHVLNCGTGFGPDVLETDAEIIDDLLIGITFPPFDSDIPAMQEFISEFEFRKPGEDITTNVLEGWIAGIFVTDAIEATGANLTRAGLIETVRTDKDAFGAWNADGLKPNIDWTTNQYELWADPDYKPDPDVCGTFLMRPDPANNRWIQVGEKPALCLNRLLTPEDAAANFADHDFSLEVDEQ